jgi:hypothetical protein
MLYSVLKIQPLLNTTFYSLKVTKKLTLLKVTVQSGSKNPRSLLLPSSLLLFVPPDPKVKLESRKYIGRLFCSEE